MFAEHGMEGVQRSIGTTQTALQVCPHTVH